MKPRVISAEALFEEHQPALKWEWVAGHAHPERRFDEAAVREARSAADLIGYLNYIHPYRVQLVGHREVAYLENADYPALIPQGQQVATISVPAVLAVYDWQKDTDRYQRLVRVVDYLFDRFEKLQKEPGYHEKWKDVNLAARVPGWQRFKPLQDRLDKVATAAAPRAIDPVQLRAQAMRAAPNDPNEQERLFKQFLEWSKKQSRQ